MNYKKQAKRIENLILNSDNKAINHSLKFQDHLVEYISNFTPNLLKDLSFIVTVPNDFEPEFDYLNVSLQEINYRKADYLHLLVCDPILNIYIRDIEIRQDNPMVQMFPNMKKVNSFVNYCKKAYANDRKWRNFVAERKKSIGVRREDI